MATKNIYWTYSDDEGRTWETESVVVTNAHNGTGNSDKFTGMRIIAGVRFVSGSSAPCNIVAVSLNAGTNTPSAEFLFKDSTATAIQFEDETFHIYPADDPSGRWVLTAKAYGSTSISEWESFDNCLTWNLI